METVPTDSIIIERLWVRVRFLIVVVIDGGLELDLFRFEYLCESSFNVIIIRTANA